MNSNRKLQRVNAMLRIKARKRRDLIARREKQAEEWSTLSQLEAYDWSVFKRMVGTPGSTRFIKEHKSRILPDRHGNW